MLKITDDMKASEMQQFSVMFPKDVHNAVKAEASIRGKKKSEFMLDLILIGAEELVMREGTMTKKPEDYRK